MTTIIILYFISLLILLPFVKSYNSFNNHYEYEHDDLDQSQCDNNWNNNSKNIKLSSPEECTRSCIENEPPKICYYNFTLEFYPAPGIPCTRCTPTITQNLKNYPICECILVDGYERIVFSVNRMIPGPQIQVCKNDFIVVDVTNQATGNEVSLHWHGLFQKNYQYYDGVPFVTQCPIGSSSTFRYQFKAAEPGTFFWHSHVSIHRLDGQYGSLIIREPAAENPHVDLYDIDDPTHVILISDWMHELATERYPGTSTGKIRGQAADNILVNGIGKFTLDNGTETDVKLATFNVQQGYRYRFRLINSFTTICLSQFSIENHSLQLISQDATNVEPVYVNTIVTGAGERVDFILNTNNMTVKSYWIQVRALGECTPKSVQQLAILKYDGTLTEKMTDTPTYLNGLPLGILYNPLDASCTPDKGTICPSNLKTIESFNNDIMRLEPDVQLVLPFRFHDYSATSTLDNLFTANQSNYPVFLVTIDRFVLVTLIDDVIYKSPSAPPLTEREGYKNFCDSNSTLCQRNAGPLPCSCTHVKNIPLNSLVEVVVYDENMIAWLSHPFHLHGGNFHVFDMGRFSDNRNITKTDIESVIIQHQQRLIKNKYDRPGQKDTIIVPQGGWVIFRYIASNPGFWLFHCHFDWHSTSGMQMIFHVGKQSDLPPVPPGFPTCGSFKPPLCII